MENNFDNFFKDKLEHRQFEMKPEYWEGAEALIEADERSRGWQRFLVWFGVALIAGLAIFFIWKNDNVNLAVEKDTRSNNTYENVLPEGSENSLSTKETFNTETSDSRKSNVENNLTPNISENNESVNTLLGNNNSSKIKEQVSKKSTTTKTLNSNSLNPNSINFPTTVPSSDSEKNEENKLNASEIKDKKAYNNSTKVNENENNPIIALNEEPKDENNKTNSSENDIKKNEERSNAEEIVVQPIASSSTILLPFLEMFLANNKKIEKLDLNTVWTKNPSRDKFAFGIFGGAVGYPLTENSSDNRFIGFKTGLLIERNFQLGNANMAMGTELTYHYRSGNFVETKQNEVARYSFGRSVSQSKLTPEDLHYFELPLYLKYQKKRMTFETGASFNYLLGVRGTVSELDGTSQSGWIPDIGFKNNYVNVLLGFHYRISDNLHFGVRGNYTPGGILDKEAVLPNGVTVALQESRPFYLTFRVTQYLNFRK